VLPKSILICGQRFTVEILPAKDMPGLDDAFGASRLIRQSIQLRADQGPDQQRDTLLHETIHMVAQLVDVEGKKFDERTVNVLATQLLDTLRRNPDLVAYLMEI
jgi:hypothetical protein